MAEAVFPHYFDYPDARNLSLPDIANSLLAQERLVRFAAEILEKSIDGLTIDKVIVRLEYASNGSLKEAFFVGLFATFQKDLEKATPEVIQSLTGYEVPEKYSTLVTVLVFVVAVYGAQYIIDRLKKKSEKPDALRPSAISGNYNTYISIAAEKLEIPGKQLERVVAQVASGANRRSVSRAAIDFFRPAKRGGDGRISPRGLPEISAEAVGEFPSEAALSELEDAPETEVLPNAVLEVRAMDRDKRNQGWAGKLHVDGLDRRAPLTLYPTVDASSLSACSRALVDVLVEFKPAPGEHRIVSRIHVLKVHRCLEEAQPLPPTPP